MSKRANDWLVGTVVLVTMIVLLVVAVRQLPQPWRGIVDLGVVVGLFAGALSIVFFAVQAVGGRLPEIAPDWPDEA